MSAPTIVKYSDIQTLPSIQTKKQAYIIYYCLATSCPLFSLLHATGDHIANMVDGNACDDSNIVKYYQNNTYI